jgi:tRNA-specific 2-thiouridylase
MAMSGGVDSSVAAALCMEAGHEVIGVSMRLYDARECTDFGSCCSPDDFDDARSVAQQLGFPYYVLNLEKRFEKDVIDNFVVEYLQGRTPIPCIHCNDLLKFEALKTKAAELECDAVATGHYARVVSKNGSLNLLKGIDDTRDQSYFLFTLTQDQMKHIYFPVGEMTKVKVREEAVRFGLKVAHKSESREICFVPNDDYAAFLESRQPNIRTAGKIVNRQGETLGEHLGIHRFTVGQRKGLGISNPVPLYVLELQPETGNVVVGTKDQLLVSGLIAGKFNWCSGNPPTTETEAVVKIRYKHPGVPAQIMPDDKGGCIVRFKKPVEAVAPGQAAVAYDGDRVIGGGWIERALP